MFMVAVGAVVGKGIWGWLAVLSVFLWFFLLLIVMTQVCVRNVFAWSLDGIVPRWLSRVRDRRAVPRNAIVCVVAIAAVFSALVAFGLIGFVNYVALFAVCYLITGIAAAVLPWRRPELLTTARQDNDRRRSRLTIALLGVANVAIFTAILGAALLSSDFGGVPPTIWPPVFLGVVYGTGYVVFTLAKARTPALERELVVNLPPE
jgi:amino acid transporter